jgi:hypothetical protein
MDQAVSVRHSHGYPSLIHQEPFDLSQSISNREANSVRSENLLTTMGLVQLPASQAPLDQELFNCTSVLPYPPQEIRQNASVNPEMDEESFRNFVSIGSESESDSGTSEAQATAGQLIYPLYAFASQTCHLTLDGTTLVSPCGSDQEINYLNGN